MKISALQELRKNGFTSESCPVTRQKMPNMTRQFDGFHLSYARTIIEYGTDTTAIVLDGRVFYILEGFHADKLVPLAEKEGIDGCIRYFMENKNSVSSYSEHLESVGLKPDYFGIADTTMSIIGQKNIDLMLKAFSSQQKDT